MTNTPATTSPFDRAKTAVHEGIDPHFIVRALTPRKRRLVEAYVREGTYAAAARASGYGSAAAKQLIDNDPGVRRAIGQLVDQAALVSGVTLERVLQEYARLAFSDVADLIDVVQAADDSDAALALLAELPPDVTAAISSIKFERKTDDEGGYVTGKLELKLWDKKGALQDLARMLSLFNDKVTVEDSSGFGQRLEAAVRKIEEMQ